MNEQLPFESPDWDSIVSEADHGLAGDLGRLCKRVEAGQVKRYLMLYEFEEEDGKSGMAFFWTRDEDQWCRGVLMTAEDIVVEQIHQGLEIGEEE